VDAWWLAPVVVLVLSGLALLVAWLTARRSAIAFERELPDLRAVRHELTALDHHLAAVASRLESRTGGAGVGTPDR
jgi:hypothetical protein